MIVPIKEIPKKPKSLPSDVEIYKIFQKLEALCLSKNGIGLSAFQIGLPYKLFVIKKENKIHHYCECDYKPIGEECQRNVESCLSILDKNGESIYYEVERFKKINFFGKEMVGIDFISVDIEVEGLYSIVYQHEIDHQNSILISDIGQKVEIL